MAGEDSQFQPTLRTDYVTLQEEQRREIQATQEERLGAGELWEAVTQSEWVAPRLSESSQFSNGLFAPPDAPAISEERLAQDLGNRYTEEEYDFIGQASSEEDYQARLDKVASDRQLAQKISGEGLRGFGYAMVASMVDPALLPLYVGTGGAGALGRASILARTLRSGALGAAEGAAVETVLASADTQRDWRDVLVAGAAGGIFTGSLTLGASGYRRLRHGSEPNPNLDTLDRNPDLTAAAQAADADLSVMAREAKVDRAIADLEEGLSIEYIQGINPRQALIDELMPLASSRLPRGQRNPILAEQASLEARVRQLSDEQARVPELRPGGTNRKLREAAQQRKERLADIERRVQPLQARLRELEQTLEQDLPAREAWADISRLQQGQVPRRFRERYEQLRQEDISPLNRSESRMTRERLAARQQDTERADAEVRRPEGEQEEPDTGSVGAARVEGARDPQDAYPESGNVSVEEHLFRAAQLAETLPKRDWIRKLAGGGSRRLSSTYSDLARSESNLIRGLAHMLLSDPQAATRGHLAASHRVANNHDRLMYAEGGREAVARDRWAREQGINPLRMHLMEGSVARDFDNAVVLEIRGVDQGSPAIKEAAQARRDLLSEALRIRKEAGESGFENVDDHAAYWSFLPDFHKMQAATANHGPEQVIELMTGAYMNGRFRLGETSARMVARATYARTMQQGLTATERSKYALSQTDIGALRADMEQAGVSAKQIDDFLEEIENTAEATGVSNRAKLSLGASMTYRDSSGLRMVDVLDTSVNVTNKYAMEAAAGAALARTGFRSRTEVESVISDAERSAKNLILEQAKGKGKDAQDEAEKRADQIGKEAKQLLDSIRLMYGESLDADLGSAVKVSRAARKLTNIIALQWNGFASMGEASNQIVNFGITTTLRNTRFADFASFGKIRKSEDLQGFYKLVGAYGQFGSSVKDNNYTLQTMDEWNQGRLERIFNNAAGWVSNKTQLLSGFRSVQHGLENVMMRSIQDRLVRVADGKLKPKQRDFDEMERAGLRRSQIDEVLKHIRDNPEYVTVDGNRVRVFSGRGLDAGLREDLGTALTVMMSRNMQRSFVGETPIWMSKELGKALTQFRSYSIVSVEKQLAGGLRGDKIGMFLKTMWGIAIGTAAYSSRAWLRSQDEDDPEERFEQYTSGPNLATGVVNMTPHLGLIGMGMELGYASGLVQVEDSSGLSRYGTRPLTAEGAVPAIGVAFDAVNAGRDIIGGTVAQDSERAMKGYKDALGLLPMVNSAAIGSAMAIANKAVD